MVHVLAWYYLIPCLVVFSTYVLDLHPIPYYSYTNIVKDGINNTEYYSYSNTHYSFNTTNQIVYEK